MYLGTEKNLTVYVYVSGYRKELNCKCIWVQKRTKLYMYLGTEKN